MTRSMTLAQARRIALAAQGLHQERPTRRATARQVGRTFERLQLLQIDSVNVLTRAHYLPLFARLGPYDRAALDRLSSRSPRRMVEYWAHEASFIRPEHHADLLLWQRRTWMGSFTPDRPELGELADRILDLLGSSRPLTAREVATRLGHHEVIDRSGWGWNRSSVKEALEAMFALGQVGSVNRSTQFERRYAPISTVLPPQARSAGPPRAIEGVGGGMVVAATDAERSTSARRLIEAAARAHGIGTVRCLADYFRLPVRAAAEAVERLVEDGVLELVDVQGWPGRQYLHHQALKPRRARARALLSPFDSLVFERRRLEELFGFHYRLEIYTPAARRRYGYYVLPFLLGQDLVARVDLKADRARGVLLVRSSHAEPEAPAETARELASELSLMAEWLGLESVQVELEGNLSLELANTVGTRSAGT
ncbi:MAG: winged helix-turn-helix domain-containing protein [Arthrobacter sp.]|uniref:winged helix-turn-helix domain-containing protein n=1 Tax=unclassified Arthrobacter TaxID=235627 RepID=UPI002650138C|nr:winged helix DNA-binding domain-containing protein [Micrococcaceae bacterium]MDN5824635.1 winged helix DNA-binding domain-containing protein [Micrococcaceae bacterium]MDN5879395.1 winged helix DNA-binding domain-containing protein [Micrococcaceae bacterium]MDN5885568.1 winged helix DNA-binding domain-containing protein [Micrococcaceae bacterium]MDN6169479.1 winged helix DNA-binding domain-containing protein [Micrococcaceae bacterium]